MRISLKATINESCRILGERGDDDGLTEVECGGDDATAGAGEIIPVGAVDLLEQSMHAEALDHPGNLRAGKVRQEAAEIADLKAAQVEFTPLDGEEDVGVERIEEVEAPVAPGLRRARCARAAGASSGPRSCRRELSRVERNSR
jgi:hypothetical protein